MDHHKEMFVKSNKEVLCNELNAKIFLNFEFINILFLENARSGNAKEIISLDPFE